MIGEGFKEYLSEFSQENNSNLILALDISEKDLDRENLEEEYIEMVDEVSDSIAGIKVGYPLVLKTGLEIIESIKEKSEIPVIADFKIADVPHVCSLIARSAYKAGADGVIAQAFVGKDSLEAITEVAKSKEEKGVIVVPSMTHEGGKMFIQPSSNQMLELAKKVKATGIIGPATRPEDVRKLRSQVGEEMIILTPGIGAQGAQPGDAIRNGADYEIVGRAIYTSEHPKKSAEEIREKINERKEEEEN